MILIVMLAGYKCHPALSVAQRTNIKLRKSVSTHHTRAVTAINCGAESRTLSMICSECALYEPDKVNPPGGLGDCEINRQNPREVALQHKDGLHYHRKLIYPGVAGCSEWTE